jgi:hypothetical protein
MGDLPPDLPPGVETAIRNAAVQAFNAGMRLGAKAGQHDRQRACDYAVNHVAYAWVTEHARMQQEAAGVQAAGGEKA